MRAWIDIDGSGRRYLTRVGTGLVLSVTPIRRFGTVNALTGSFGKGSVTEADAPFHRIDILVDGVCGSSPAIRFQARAIVATGDPMFAVAIEAMQDEASCSFTIEWHEHGYFPSELPIDVRDPNHDTCGILIGLVSMREHAQAIPDSVPAEWSQDSGAGEVEGIWHEHVLRESKGRTDRVAGKATDRRDAGAR